MSTLQDCPNWAYWLAGQTGELVPKAEGTPGVGKTQIAYAFTKALSRKVYTLIGSLKEPPEIGGFPYPVKGETVVIDPVTGQPNNVYMALIAPKWAFDAQSGGWIIFLDELTTCPPAVQAAMLRVINEKHVGDTPLPKDTWFYAACNPPGLAANGQELSAPMSNRMLHFPWERYTRGFHAGLCNGGCDFPAPPFPILPAGWEAFRPVVGSEVSAFLTQAPDFANQCPVDDPEKQSGPYPSDRSWTFGVIGMAATRAAGGTPDQEETMLEACIGPDAVVAFRQYRLTLDIPDAEKNIRQAVTDIAAGRPVNPDLPTSGDRMIAYLGAIQGRVAVDKNPARYDAAGAIFQKAAEHWIEVVAIACGDLMRNPPEGCLPHMGLAGKVRPIMEAAGLMRRKVA